MMHGGGVGDGGNRYADVWEWDGTRWTEIPHSGVFPSARATHAAVYLDSEQSVLIVGGDAPGGIWKLDLETTLKPAIVFEIAWDAAEISDASRSTAPATVNPDLPRDSVLGIELTMQPRQHHRPHGAGAHLQL